MVYNGILMGTIVISVMVSIGLLLLVFFMIMSTGGLQKLKVSGNRMGLGM